MMSSRFLKQFARHAARGTQLMTLMLVVLATAACLEPLDPADTPIQTVIVRIGANRTVDTIQVRHTARVQASAYSDDGFDTGFTDFTYSSSDETVATVDANGTVQGIAPGTAIIKATEPGGRFGSVTVVVQPTVIAYTLAAALNPGAIAFSTDYTRAFVAVEPDSVVVLDALGFFRIGSVALEYAPHGLAATSSRVYATHPEIDSVSVINTATGVKTGTIWVGAGPTGAAASGNIAYFATRFDRKVVIVDNGVLTLGIPLSGEPHELAISLDGTRLFASIDRGTAWRIAIMDPTFPDTLGSVSVPARPTALTTNRDGSRLYALVGTIVYVFTTADGTNYSPAGTVTAGTNAGGIAASTGGNPYVVVSGDETVIFNGETLEVLERIPEAGRGHVRVRPDGLFAFISSPQANVVHVVVL